MRVEFTKILENGGVGVMPTDTIYGLVGKALFKKTVTRIYKLRKKAAASHFQSKCQIYIHAANLYHGTAFC